MTKLDYKTKLFILLTGGKKCKHADVIPNQKRELYTETAFNTTSRDLYYFDNYDEYRDYFKMYLDDVADEDIGKAIYTTGKQGQIVAFKGMCEHIIIYKKMYDYYEKKTKQQQEEIHQRGNITSFEYASEFYKNNICLPSIDDKFTQKRCDFFSKRCNDCLLEYASHQTEYNPPKIKALRIK